MAKSLVIDLVVASITLPGRDFVWLAGGKTA